MFIVFFPLLLLCMYISCIYLKKNLLKIKIVLNVIEKKKRKEKSFVNKEGFLLFKSIIKIEKNKKKFKGY